MKRDSNPQLADTALQPQQHTASYYHRTMVLVKTHIRFVLVAYIRLAARQACKPFAPKGVKGNYLKELFLFDYTKLDGLCAVFLHSCEVFKTKFLNGWDVSCFFLVKSLKPSF